MNDGIVLKKEENKKKTRKLKFKLKTSCRDVGRRIKIEELGGWGPAVPFRYMFEDEEDKRDALDHRVEVTSATTNTATTTITATTTSTTTHYTTTHYTTTTHISHTPTPPTALGSLFLLTTIIYYSQI